jgi:hypothetical protein
MRHRRLGLTTLAAPSIASRPSAPLHVRRIQLRDPVASVRIATIRAIASRRIQLRHCVVGASCGIALRSHYPVAIAFGAIAGHPSAPSRVRRNHAIGCDVSRISTSHSATEDRIHRHVGTSAPYYRCMAVVGVARRIRGPSIRPLRAIAWHPPALSRVRRRSRRASRARCPIASGHVVVRVIATNGLLGPHGRASRRRSARARRAIRCRLGQDAMTSGLARRSRLTSTGARAR